MDGVHVVDECLHGLVYAVHGLVDGMLLKAGFALKTCEVFLQIVVDGDVVEVAQVFACQLLQVLHLFLIRHAYVRGKIEVEGWNCLTTVHLVLASFQRNASQYCCSLDALCWTARTMTGCESMFENDIQWVLYASQTLGRIIVFIMDMNVVMHDGVANILREEVVVDEWLGGF